MNTIRLFTREHCQRCPAAKDIATRLQKEGVKIQVINTSTIDGYAEATFYNVLSTPTWVVTDKDGVELFFKSDPVVTKEDIVFPPQ